MGYLDNCISSFYKKYLEKYNKYTLKEEKVAGKKCRESRDCFLFFGVFLVFFVTLKQEVTEVRCRKNSNTKMSRQFIAADYWKRGKISPKTHLININLAVFSHNFKKYPECKQRGRWKVQKRAVETF